MPMKFVVNAQKIPSPQKAWDTTEASAYQLMVGVPIQYQVDVVHGGSIPLIQETLSRAIAHASIHSPSARGLGIDWKSDKFATPDSRAGGFGLRYSSKYNERRTPKGAKAKTTDLKMLRSPKVGLKRTPSLKELHAAKAAVPSKLAIDQDAPAATKSEIDRKIKAREASIRACYAIRTEKPTDEVLIKRRQKEREDSIRATYAIKTPTPPIEDGVPKQTDLSIAQCRAIREITLKGGGSVDITLADLKQSLNELNKQIAGMIPSEESYRQGEELKRKAQAEFEMEVAETRKKEAKKGKKEVQPRTDPKELYAIRTDTPKIKPKVLRDIIGGIPDHDSDEENRINRAGAILDRPPVTDPKDLYAIRTETPVFDSQGKKKLPRTDPKELYAIRERTFAPKTTGKPPKTNPKDLYAIRQEKPAQKGFTMEETLAAQETGIFFRDSPEGDRKTPDGQRKRSDIAIATPKPTKLELMARQEKWTEEYRQVHKETYAIRDEVPSYLKNRARAGSEDATLNIESRFPTDKPSSKPLLATMSEKADTIRGVEPIEDNGTTRKSRITVRVKSGMKDSKQTSSEIGASPARPAGKRPNAKISRRRADRSASKGRSPNRRSKKHTPSTPLKGTSTSGFAPTSDIHNESNTFAIRESLERVNRMDDTLKADLVDAVPNTMLPSIAPVCAQTPLGGYRPGSYEEVVKSGPERSTSEAPIGQSSRTRAASSSPRSRASSSGSCRGICYWIRWALLLSLILVLLILPSYIGHERSFQARAGESYQFYQETFKRGIAASKNYFSPKA